MSAEQDSLLPFQMPLDNHVGKSDRSPVVRMLHFELLQRDLAAALFKMSLEVFLLLQHLLCGGDSGAKITNRLKMGKGTFAVEGYVLKRQIARRGPLGPGGRVVEQQNSRQREENRNCHRPIEIPA